MRNDDHRTEETDPPGLSKFSIHDLGWFGWALCGLAGLIEIGAYASNPPFAAPLAVHVPIALTAGVIVAGFAAANFTLLFRLLGKFHDSLEDSTDE